MPQFKFVARNSDGKLIDGIITCNDRAAAIYQVEKDKCVPIKIEPVKESASSATTGPKPTKTAKPASPAKPAESKPAESGKKVDTLGHAQLYLFTEQLAHLLSAGMTLDEALGVLVKRLKHPRLSVLSKALHQALLEGRSLSQAMREYPKIFTPLYTNMVSAGEASGGLGEILRRLVLHLSELKSLRDRVQQAMIYPAILIVIGLLLIVVFIKVMVPQVMGLFSKTGQKLPFATEILLTANRWLTNYGWLALLSGVGVFFLFKAYVKTPEGRKNWDTFVWKFPVFSAIIRYRYYAQFARTLGTLMENGVTLLRSLELLEEISGNEFVRFQMSHVRRAVVDGATVSVAISEQGIFPELFSDMMAVGEQSGKFAQTMQMIADVFERELDKQIQITTSLIPPMIMIGIAGVVGLVVYGILSAVFSLTEGLHA